MLLNKRQTHKHSQSITVPTCGRHNKLAITPMRQQKITDFIL